MRSLWVGLHLVAATLVLGPLALAAALLRAPDRFFDWAGRAWASWILWASRTPVHVEGLEHVRADRPQIFAANHQSWYDVFALAVAIPKRYRFVGKRELARIPLFGTAWKAAGHISIDRRDRAAAIRSLERAGRLVRRDNSSIIVFPEGTRSRDGRLLPFKKGAVMLALCTGIELVPVAISGTRAILPKGAWRVRPGPIIVRFGEPIRVAGLGEEDRDRVVAELRARIEVMLEGRRAARRAS